VLAASVLQKVSGRLATGQLPRAPLRRSASAPS